ncbi:MAG: serine/threonine protein kinase [Deltaproteobacteria bacterium]|nr:serine/threonine protein kinase [Deltaproteobacteria bacterium]
MLARFGDYLLFDRLNQGGMAEIYLAKSFGYRGANQILVLKCIRTDHSTDPAFVSMFIEEAKLSALLSHQNIVRTYELGRVGERHFIAMEYLPGRDLRSVLDRIRIQGKVFPEELALHIIAQTCEGLDYAHRKVNHDGEPLNIIHRDVSPPNVLIGFDGQVKLIDFGVAKISARNEQSRVFKGKYAYMSPEQTRGRIVDARSDVFSAGVVLFELLTSRRLFTGRTELSVIDKVRHAEIYPPKLLNPDISEEAEAVFLQATSLDPDDRFQSAGEMRDAIIGILLSRKMTASSRQLASLMRDIFVEELNIEETRLGELRSMEMPAIVANLEEITVATPSNSDNDIETQIKEKTDITKRLATQPLVNSQTRLIDHIIMVGLVAVILGLVILLIVLAH